MKSVKQLIEDRNGSEFSANAEWLIKLQTRPVIIMSM
jgi:hypothetical protein